MNIILDLRPNALSWGIEKLKDTIPRLGPDDELTLILDNTDAHEADLLMNELDKHGFDLQPKGSDGTTYNIIAKRHLIQ